jgi:polysaccharide export outer membrane protein
MQARRLFTAGVVILVMALSAGHKLQAQVSSYVVGPLDVLAIDVYSQPTLRGNYPVDADGTFTFPLLGRTKVGGLTLREVEELLRVQLANGFLKNPQVSVAVAQYRSQRVFVVGEVRAPGTYPLTENMTLIEVLARAGSATETASGEALVVRPHQANVVSGPVLPSQGKDAEVIRVDIKDLQSGKLSENLPLLDGDTIFVPRVELIYISGQVRTPGSYPLKRGMTVLQVLSLAGGVSDRGAINRIRVIRMVNGKRTERKIGEDETVNSGDTLVVPERFF